MRVTSLGYQTDLTLRVADPADVAIRVYRACGFADYQAQFSFERPPA
jgi:hypothetical protein